MATVQRMEDLVIYQKSRELVKGIYATTRKGGFAKDFALVDQIRRAGVSIISNIAEGFERGGNAEFTQFLWIAKGSCGEVRAQLMVAMDQGYITKEEHELLENSAMHIGAMIHRLIDSMKGSGLKGRRYAANNADAK
jgi:four helix bundle protein